VTVWVVGVARKARATKKSLLSILARSKKEM
jgi:hypothetical protein